MSNSIERLILLKAVDLFSATPGESRCADAIPQSRTILLRLDQAAFYELVDDRIEIAHGLLRVLNQRLRTTVNDPLSVRQQSADVLVTTPATERFTG